MLNSFQAALAPAGLNLVGVASVADWDASQPEARRSAALCEGARSVVVVGNGGTALWDALIEDLRGEPRHLTEEAHPVDAFVRRHVDAMAPLLAGYRHRWFFAAAEAEVHIDFRMLAQLAGLGADSKLGLLLHPVYGPWLGLRAACFIDEEMQVSSRVSGSCEGCAAPCASACPGAAFAEGKWAVDPCAAFHQTSTVCASSCDARAACPVGAEHRYEALQYQYHYNRAVGRHALRDFLNINADSLEGVGPHWGTWRAKVDVKGKAGS